VTVFDLQNLTVTETAFAFTYAIVSLLHNNSFVIAYDNCYDSNYTVCNA